MSPQLLLADEGTPGDLSSLPRLQCRGACRVFSQQEGPGKHARPGWCFRLGSGDARVQPLPLVRNVQALGQRLCTAPQAAALERSPRPARAARGQFRVGRSGPRFVSVDPLPSRRRGWAGEDAASARARSALQLVCVREWEAAGLRLRPSRLTAPTPQLQS